MSQRVPLLQTPCDSHFLQLVGLLVPSICHLKLRQPKPDRGCNGSSRRGEQTRNLRCTHPAHCSHKAVERHKKNRGRFSTVWNPLEKERRSGPNGNQDSSETLAKSLPRPAHVPNPLQPQESYGFDVVLPFREDLPTKIHNLPHQTIFSLNPKPNFQYVFNAHFPAP